MSIRDALQHAVGRHALLGKRPPQSELLVWKNACNCARCMISAIKNTLPQTISIQTDLTRRTCLLATGCITFSEFRLTCLRAAMLTAVWKKHYEYMQD